jgi:hypothetical protein
MPVPPAELSAEYTIGGPDAAHDAARAAAQPWGLAREAGPATTLLAGGREPVLAALNAVVVAALDAGAYEIDLRLEAPVDVRRGQGA